MDSIAVCGQGTGVRSGLSKQAGYNANSFLAGERFSMSKASCGSGQPVKLNNQSACGMKGASHQLASAHVYPTPSIEKLISAIKPDDIVLAYVVKTCEPKRDESSASIALEHTGSGPNIAGGRITLCTCKRKMRTSPVFLAPALRSRIWIAGFSRSTLDGKNWLFYLMKVGETFDSQREIYERLKSNPDVLEKKLATDFVLGDIFVPKNPCRSEFDPSCYKPPHPNHAHTQPPHRDTWKNDINFQGYGGRYPKMLLGDEVDSYCYPNGKIFLNTVKPMTQGNRRMSGEDFLALLNDSSVP